MAITLPNLYLKQNMTYNTTASAISWFKYWNNSLKDSLIQHDSKKTSMNKKSELLLMRRARAYGSSCSQVILVYLNPFYHNSLFCSQKKLFLGFKANQDHQCW